MPEPISSPSPLARFRGITALLGTLVVLALGLALYQFLTGNDHTLPVGTVAQLTPVPVTVARIPTGLDSLALQVNGYLVTQTRDVGGPELWPAAATLWVVWLGVALTVWLAVISTLARPAFLGGMVAVIFLLMSLNVDVLEVFGAQRYFLLAALILLGGAAFVLQAFLEHVSLGLRLVLFAVLVVGLGALLYWRAPFPAAYITLHLAAYGTLAGAAAVVLLALWVGVELIFALLWFNTQSDNPKSRFGLLPFVLTSLLLLGSLLFYYLNGGQLQIFPGGIYLDPYLLVLLAAVAGWWGLPQRARTYTDWLPYPAAALLYLTLLLVAIASAGYAAATANGPVLSASRELAALALLSVGGAFFLYLLLNFAPLMRKRLQVFRVAYDPRRLPFYTVYLLAAAAMGAVLVRNNADLIDQVHAGQYVQLGDLTRFQSEGQPNDEYLALLAERYYAEADQLDPRNARAALGRAALYQRLAQRQNEINILRLTLEREPNEKALLRLAARFDQATDFFEHQQILRQGLRSYPASRWLNTEMAQLYTRSALTDSVVYYHQRAVAVDADDAVAHTNWLAFLLKNNQLRGAQEATAAHPLPSWLAWQSNDVLRQLMAGASTPLPASQTSNDSVLTAAQFARFYHVGLMRAARRDTAMLPSLRRLRQLPANDAFADQLIFLQALTQLRSQEPAQGYNLMETLAAGDNGGYFHHVLGLYLLERGLYASAAPRFQLAQQTGDVSASLPRAYAFALSSQPDSARAAASVAAATPALATSAKRLVDALPLQAKPVPFQPLAAQFRQAAGLPKRAAENQYRRLVEVDPFSETGIVQAADFFAGQGQYLAAYEALRRATQYNPESTALLQRFALAAADAGLVQYGDQTVAKLRPLLPSAEYITFQRQYDKRRAVHRAAAAPWD
ncbi:hypothetical protein F0P96_05550 [Hymenobacter busanensis]|uniref:Uncharacterized protein n=1 Tax=Hymenobacter busanensis TaxID=2607656 RepID=A0A7L5A276_9BACT|nr:hypothetical protein [Hymenobacter busanensis]KAA9338303.1 hypothetical protein F0P96_05550 [Hymenobacter busanensis]QHJ09273.1 hypothetical protein GUY19_19060 [Hymenobacter busanensis]